MNILSYIGILLLTFFCMEAVTWCTHKFVMHGFLWVLHADHHRPARRFFEKNDAFFLIFAIPSFLLILLGTLHHRYYFQAAGFGIMAYGAAYFLVHDVIIHQRFKWFSRSRHPYIADIRFAHKMHHKHLGREHGEAFGLLFVPRKYRKKKPKQQPHA
ncbi:MAG: beta-carotene hydroxylase [Bacteroidetes bacterium]|nr:beta-carotene hydroxylase [Bacteroidota bacterium]